MGTPNEEPPVGLSLIDEDESLRGKIRRDGNGLC